MAAGRSLLGGAVCSHMVGLLGLREAWDQPGACCGSCTGAEAGSSSKGMLSRGRHWGLLCVAKAESR